MTIHPVTEYIKYTRFKYFQYYETYDWTFGMLVI